MGPRFETIAEKKLVGYNMKMSFADNKTHELWHSFMPRRLEIRNPVIPDLYSMQLFGPAFDFRKFNPNAEFVKWAAMEVDDFDAVPDNMETITLPAGLYAVFIHKGPASEGPKTFGYIFGQWLPHSDYELDNRPHFELLGEKYKNNAPDSEEEVWIPVKRKP